MARGNARWKSGHHALEELSPAELSYWKASYRLDPWGDDWERTSAMTAVIVNEMRRKEKDVELMELGELVPFRPKPNSMKRQLQKSLSNLETLVGLPE